MASANGHEFMALRHANTARSDEISDPWYECARTVLTCVSAEKSSAGS
jgi:hypothetical protein